MAKRLSREEKIDKFVIDAINEMFRIAGHEVTYDDIKDRKDNWFHDWTMTMDQNAEWQRWGKKYLQKNLNMYAKRAEKEMQWASLMWGLKYSDFPGNEINESKNEQTAAN
jgi:Lon protease-like protein